MRGEPVKGWHRELRWDAASSGHLKQVERNPAFATRRPAALRRSLYRDTYLDTTDRILRGRGTTCWLHVTADDRRELWLAIDQPDGRQIRVGARVRGWDAVDVLAEANAVTRRLRGIADPVTIGACSIVEVERLTRTAARDWRGRPSVDIHFDTITVRRGTAARSFHQVAVAGRKERDATFDQIAAGCTRELGPPVTDTVLSRAELLLKWMPVLPGTDPEPQRDAALGAAATPESPEFLHPDLSFLESQGRVLTLAESERTPLAERLRFLAIVSANLDEFFMVRVAGLKLAAPDLAEESAAGWGDASAQLSAIGASVRALKQRHHTATRSCLAAAEAHDTRLLAWHELTDAERTDLRERYREEIHPELTPLAMTLSPGHPLPRVPHLSLSIAVVLRDDAADRAHFAEVEIPPDLPPLLRVDRADRIRHFIPVEEVIRANLDALYPQLRVEHAYVYRVTRSSLLVVDESAPSLLDAVDAATRHRVQSAVVRVEVDARMPQLLRELVLDAIRREGGDLSVSLGHDDVHDLAAPPDPRIPAALELPEDPALRYGAFVPREVAPAGTSFFDRIAREDLLVHHPWDSFTDSVVRFLEEAATDPHVTTVRITLYRVGDHSPIVDALRTAARAGKQVHAFIELRARFDEATNVKWVRALETAGVHVTYGLRGLKTHAKATLVVRREGTRLRRYVHVGSGNYNARTGLLYTDFSLFSADEDIGADLTDFFNGLTGSSVPRAVGSRGALVAPGGMAASLLEYIAREAAHARAGVGGAIRMKMNGLSDPEVVQALTNAAAAGVQVDLVVRGICTLRPRAVAAPGDLRVVATAGRFLEHSRVYHFANAGHPLWFIGSADLRPRNLRRRVELLVPIRAPKAQAMLGRVLDTYLEDATAWALMPDGQYVQRGGGQVGAQELLQRESAPAMHAKAKWQHDLKLTAR